MKCCSAQIESVWDDPERSLVKAEPFISEASRAGAALIAFPEQFPTGWDPLSHAHVEECTGRIVSTLQTFARKYSIAIVGSFRERFSPYPRNTAVAIGKDGGILAMYAKMHLFSRAREDMAYTPGTTLPTFSIDGVRCGMAICYDLRFPALFRIYAKMGVHAVFVPAAWPQTRIRHWELFISARAAENQMYVVGINTTGINPVDRYSGASMTADPYGTIVSRASDGKEPLLSELDPTLVDRLRHDFPIENDRRDALYHSLLNQQI
jgi:predicted amidohydrolase